MNCVPNNGMETASLCWGFTSDGLVQLRGKVNKETKWNVSYAVTIEVYGSNVAFVCFTVR